MPVYRIEDLIPLNEASVYDIKKGVSLHLERDEDSGNYTHNFRVKASKPGRAGTSIGFFHNPNEDYTFLTLETSTDNKIRASRKTASGIEDLLSFVIATSVILRPYIICYMYASDNSNTKKYSLIFENLFKELEINYGLTKDKYTNRSDLMKLADMFWEHRHIRVPATKYTKEEYYPANPQRGVEYYKDKYKTYKPFSIGIDTAGNIIIP